MRSHTVCLEHLRRHLAGLVVVAGQMGQHLLDQHGGLPAEQHATEIEHHRLGSLQGHGLK